MVKEIRKIGNSKGMIFDAVILDAMKVDVGDKVEVTVHSSGAVTLSPIKPKISEEELEAVLDQIMTDNAELLRRLS